MSLTFFVKQIKDSICSLVKFSYVLVASFVDLYLLSVVMVCLVGSKFLFVKYH
jgi:hypothetical protein